ncbi:Acetyl-CoA biotin carboxyl carrier [Phycisphaerae bacterium RAS1]|nr:Acetyl-CoA biotin carboxyl carrier [Phycisphaerae bacterium RAS1]
MDIEYVKSLIEMMAANDLSRVEIHEGETHILLRRGQPVVSMPAMHTPVIAAPLPAVAAPPAAGAPAAASGAAPAALEPANEKLIRSPMVGTFYVAADPESPPFVKIGDQVGPDSVVCLIEAMKVFNEIKAETGGRITRVLVSNAQAVEFDQPLFAVV